MSDTLLKNFLDKGSSGLIHKPDTRDHVLDQEILGAGTLEIKPLGRLERLLASDLVKPENILYQGGTLSCVSNASAFLNMWNSLIYDNNPHCESWAYLYKNVPHFGGGTSMNDNLNILKKKGCCLESTLPARPLADGGETRAQDRSVLTQEMDDEAQHFKIEGYLSLTDLRREALYRVLVETPISIAFDVGNTFSSKAGIDPPSLQYRTFGHNAVLFDVVGESNIGLLNNMGMYLDQKHYGWWIVPNWWEKDRLDIRVVSPLYHIFAGKVLKDRRDTKLIRANPKLEDKSMNVKLIKSADKPEVFLLNLDGKKCWIRPLESLKQIIGEEAESHIEILTQDVIDSYPVGPVLDIGDRGILQAILTMLKGLGAKK